MYQCAFRPKNLAFFRRFTYNKNVPIPSAGIDAAELRGETVHKYCFGVDVGASFIKYGLFTTDGEAAEKWVRPTEPGERILADITAEIDACMRRRGIDAAEVSGLGLGVPGPVDREGALSRAVNLGWGAMPLAERMTVLTGLETRAANDSSLAALGEHLFGGGTDYRDMALVTLGTGVGAGVICGGKLLLGAHGAAGEIGHMHISDDITEPCACGSRGCLDQLASVPGVLRIAREQLAAGSAPSLLRERELTAESLWLAVREGDHVAVRTAEIFGDALGRALAALSLAVDPQLIVIGGGMAAAGAALLNYIQKYYIRYAFADCAKAAFRLARLGGYAGIYGAAALFMDRGRQCL